MNLLIRSTANITLEPRLSVVVGASRGVGRGVALGLADAGARVFATGRTVEQAELVPNITRIACDHTNDDAVAGVFEHIEGKVGKLDILVNVAWGGYERMVEGGRFTFMSPFWEQPTWRWDAGLVRTEAVLTAGVFDLSNSESPEFIGRAVAALANDPAVARRNGSVLVAAALAQEYGFTDVDGRQPRPLTLADV